MASGSGQPQEFIVRVPSRTSHKKKISMMKFSEANKVEFANCGGAKLERENNLKEFKTAYNIDTQPKFGAGSEFGKEQREEARRRKYGIRSKTYNPDAQPWMLKLGSGKQTRKFKGTMEGTISENASYFIFTQCPDGAFEACPVEDWYSFVPQIKYRYMGHEEAEEEFNRRDKTLNYFSLMMKRRLKNEAADEEEEDEEKGKKTKKKRSKDFMLTEMEDWANSSDDESGQSGENSDSEMKEKKKKKKKKGSRKKEGKVNSDDEAVEESDSVDEGAEVDYMTDTDSEDEVMYEDKGSQEASKYEEKGVADEDGLRKLMSSEDEDEEEKEEDKGGDEDEEKNEVNEKSPKDGSDSESSSSSDSDSDFEKDDKFSALFLQKKERRTPTPKPTTTDEPSGSKDKSSRPSSPQPDASTSKKRKLDDDHTAAKKPKTESFLNKSSLSSDGITEDAVRRYLMRKPMTTIDLLQKFKSKNTGLTKEQMVNTIAKILKKLNPEKNRIKDKLYLFIKKSE